MGLALVHSRARAGVHAPAVRVEVHLALHVEFLARHQVQPAQAGLQHRLEVLLQLLAAFLQARWHQAAEAAGEFVDVAEVDHSELVAVDVAGHGGHGWLRCWSVQTDRPARMPLSAAAAARCRETPRRPLPAHATAGAMLAPANEETA